MLDGHVQRLKREMQFGFYLDAQSHLFLEVVGTAIPLLVVIIYMGF
jgi:hypothetical protein